MSIFDDPNVKIEIGGVEVDLPTARDLAAVGSKIQVDWRVVRRWCVDHPLRPRMFTDLAIQAASYVRRKYPELTVRILQVYGPPKGSGPGKARRIDMLVVYVPEGEENPFWEVKDRGPVATPRSDEGTV